MDYTQNLHLPQWEETDRIHHDDFNDAFQAIDAAVPRIVMGTYLATDVYGSSNPNSLSFDFIPKFLLIWDSDGNSARGFNGKDMVSACLSIGQGKKLTTTWGTTVTWYTTSSTNGTTYQMNNRYYSYHYLAIG